MIMGREYELKYRASPEIIAAIHAKFGEFHYCSATAEIRLWTTPRQAPAFKEKLPLRELFCAMLSH